MKKPTDNAIGYLYEAIYDMENVVDEYKNFRKNMTKKALEGMFEDEKFYNYEKTMAILIELRRVLKAQEKMLDGYASTLPEGVCWPYKLLDDEMKNDEKYMKEYKRFADDKCYEY